MTTIQQSIAIQATQEAVFLFHQRKLVLKINMRLAQKAKQSKYVISKGCNHES